MQIQENIFDTNFKTHSLNNVWYRIYDTLSSNMDANILVVDCGVGYLVKYLLDRGFVNVRGIDCHLEFISKGQELCPDLKDKILCANFFRLTDKDKEAIDFFVFVKTLEYSENDIQYIKHLKKDSKVLIAYPNYDDGLALKHFDSKQGMVDYFEEYLQEMKVSPITLYKNAEFMVDQAIYLLQGSVKG